MLLYIHMRLTISQKESGKNNIAVELRRQLTTVTLKTVDQAAETQGSGQSRLLRIFFGTVGPAAMQLQSLQPH